MEDMIRGLTQIIDFKDNIAPGDIAIVLLEEVPENIIYASVTGIERDESRRDEWWHLSLALLSVPMQSVTWTLRTPQMTGMEIFTMGGNKRFIKAVELPVLPEVEQDKTEDRRSHLRLVK
ncbi:MAG: hypothetical protein CSB24_05465 [Deltaproteobacteria bacterium]|nr:MAG: hypothetical protein CSB24_05465 [Deltaproteobacteria bacterium]